MAQPGPSSNNVNGAGSFNFAPGQQRRPQVAQRSGLIDMGGMGGSMRPPGKSGLTFEHILSRLQGELQKSRETGAELHTLSGTMNDIHDTLGGNLVRASSLQSGLHDTIHISDPALQPPVIPFHSSPRPRGLIVAIPATSPRPISTIGGARIHLTFTRTVLYRPVCHDCARRSANTTTRTQFSHGQDSSI